MGKKSSSGAASKRRSKKQPGPAEVDLGLLNPILDKYQDERGAIIPMLQEAQGVYGYLPRSVIERIAEAGGAAPSQVYGIATFYAQFRLQPVGQHVIRVCHGTACHVNGAERISETIENVLGIKEGATTPDGKFTLLTVVCLGCCSLAPVMMINEETYGRLTANRVKTILKSY